MDSKQRTQRNGYCPIADLIFFYGRYIPIQSYTISSGGKTNKVFSFVYGVISYLIFFITFLYAIGFIADLVVPKTIDTGIQTGTGTSWVVNVFLLSLFALQHSIMARQGFKRWLTRFVPKPIERSTYVLGSSIALILLFWLWIPMTATIWHVQSATMVGFLTGLSFLGWAVVLFGTFLINHFNLFGLQQVYLNLVNREQIAPQFVTPLFYKVVRHPLMLGFIIAFWATPHMTIGHLLFAVASTGYILVGIQLEERDLVSIHGQAYVRYQHKVSQIIPLPPRKEIAGTLLQRH